MNYRRVAYKKYEHLVKLIVTAKYSLNSGLHLEKLTVSLKRVHLEKLIVAQLVKKDSSFYGTPRLISVHKRKSLIPVLGNINPAHTLKFTSFYFPLLNPLRRISPSSRPCATFRNVFLFTVRCIQLSAQHPNRRTTAYSRPAQRAARGQHVAPDTLLCCPW